MLKNVLAILTCAALAAVAQTPIPSASKQTLAFMDVSDGDLITQANQLHVTLNRQANNDFNPPTVLFFFTPENSGISFPVGADSTGAVREFGPDCATPDCLQRGVYTLTVGDAMRRLPGGWGRLSARIAGHRQDDASLRVYLQYLPGDPAFAQPGFQQNIGAGGSLPVRVGSQADSIVDFQASWTYIGNNQNRNINPFEQHVLGAALTPNGSLSCVPTSAGANLAWLQDTGQWNTISKAVNGCVGGRDYCLVTTLGFLMKTGIQGGGTTGAGEYEGLTKYLSSLGYIKGTDYQLYQGFPGNPGLANITVPEFLLWHFAAGDIMTVAIYSLPGWPAFGHILALDNIIMNPDGSAMVRLMDPISTAKPPVNGIYRWFHLSADGTMDFAAGIPTPGYAVWAGPQMMLQGVQIVSGFHQSGLVSSSLASHAQAAAVVPTSGQIVMRPQSDGRTWTGTFTPPAGSPGPWLLLSEITLESGHKLRGYQYVTGPSAVR